MTHDPARESFEAWAKSQSPTWIFDLEWDDEFDEYAWEGTYAAFLAWQAARDYYTQPIQVAAGNGEE